ncbi:MAG: tetratricopeptide repeat protein, partial [Planctomycetes bacterium]|nr:tetratricopeptide repeat protein [Planctomycetota bacterium]
MSNDPSTPEKPTHIEGVDPQGRPVRIEREQYRTKVLPDLIKASQDDPERLTAVIMQGLREGVAEDLIAAANRLTVIDKANLERALTVLAVVQRDSGELDLAESTLNELLQRKPGSPAAYVGLGMLQEKQGDLDACEELLLKALASDPNHPDAVHGYLQVRHRRVGDDGYRAEVEKLMALDGAWRAHLWMARLHLQNNEDDQAAAIYRDVLDNEHAQIDGMVMAAGDLLQAGKTELLEQLILPRFEPGKHHPQVGMVLLQLYRMKQDHVAGEELLHKMHVFYGHAIGGELQPFTAEFDRMRLATLPPPPQPPANPQVNILRLDRPVWYAGLDDPQWLLPPKQQGHKHVVVFSLALEGQPKLEPHQEEEVGRATRSLPLWFAEQVWLTTQNRGTAALAMAQHGGWAVLGRPWPEEQLCDQMPENERADTILVTGQMKIDGERRRIELHAFDCGKRARIGTAVAEGAHHEHGDLLLKLMAELWPMVGGAAGNKPPLGEGPFWHRYADALAQHAAVVITATGGMPKERLYGVRFVAQWLQGAALAETRWQPGFWALGSAMCVLRDLGSK